MARFLSEPVKESKKEKAPKKEEKSGKPRKIDLD